MWVHWMECISTMTLALPLLEHASHVRTETYGSYDRTTNGLEVGGAALMDSLDQADRDVIMEILRPAEDADEADALDPGVEQ